MYAIVKILICFLIPKESRTVKEQACARRQCGPGIQMQYCSRMRQRTPGHSRSEHTRQCIRDGPECSSGYPHFVATPEGVTIEIVAREKLLLAISR